MAFRIILVMMLVSVMEPASPSAAHKPKLYVLNSLSDDVTVIAARAVVGVLAGAPFDGFPNNRIGDGVNSNDRPYQESFPYVSFANSGRNSRHQDPRTSGCAQTVLPFAAANCPVD